MKKLFLILFGLLTLTLAASSQNVITSGYVFLNFDDSNPVWPTGWTNGRLNRMAQEGIDGSPCTRVNLYSYTNMETTFFQSAPIEMGDKPVFSINMKITRRVGASGEEALSSDTPITYSMSISNDNGATWNKLMEVVPGEHPANTDYMLFSPDVSTYANQLCMVRFDASTPLPATSFGIANHYIRLDDIAVGTPPASDLAAIAITPGTNHKEGVEAIHTVTVMNTGVTEQNTYTVKLMSVDDNDVSTEVGSTTISGRILNSQQTADVDVVWTPTTAGNVTIYGKVVGANDNDESNNDTKCVTVNVWQANDLAARMISGNVTPTVNQSATFSVTLENLGHRAQKNYTIKLMQAQENGDDIVLASQQIQDEAITARQTHDIRFVWTPTTVGAGSLYATVELDNDFNINNNRTETLNINVQPQDAFALSIGAGTEKTHLPYNFQYSKSLSQSLYFPYELGMIGGEISQITYKADITSEGAVNDNMQNIAIKVWIGETDKDNLADEYIDPATMTLVYDGQRSFPTGEYDVTIDFIEPYKYKGGNLVIYSYQNNELYGGYADLFYSSEYPGSSRSRHWYNDRFPDPENPNGTAGTHHVYNGIPNTRFQLTEESLNSFGSIHGVVSDANGVLANAKIYVEGTKYVATTNASGEYALPMMAAGEYTLGITKYGYNTQTETIVVNSKESKELNIELSPRKAYTFSGYVNSFNTRQGVENAIVEFNCEDTYKYTAITDANGAFTFTEDGNSIKLSEGHYDVVISATDLDTFVGTIDLNTNVADREFILYEIPYPVAAIRTDIADNTMTISWDAPAVPDGKISNLEGYILYRLLRNAPEAEWTVIDDNIAAGMLEYTDQAWATLPWGVYQYALKSKYPDNQRSEALISTDNVKDMTVEYTVSAFTNLGVIPLGATVVLTNTDGIAEHIYTATLSETGAIFDNVWRGTYNIAITKQDYIRPYSAANIVIEESGLAHNAIVEEIPYAAVSPTAEVVDGNAVISWSRPKTYNQWCTWVITDQINGGMAPMGVVGEELTTAIRFTPEDLKNFGVINGQYITQVSLGIARKIQEVEKMQIQIWEGGESVENAGELVYTQDITDIIGNEKFAEYTRVTIDLTTPYAINPDKEVRIGWTIPDIDGRIVQGIGPREDENGPVWNNGKMTLWKSSASMNYWKDASLMQGGQFRNCIKAFVSNDPSGKAKARNLANAEEEIIPIRYNVFRFAEDEQDDESTWVNIAENITDLSCTDRVWSDLPEGNYQYAVVANYAGEHAQASLSNILGKRPADIENVESTRFCVYPNPTTDWINIEDSETIGSLYLFDASGKLISYKENINSNTTRLDMSGLINGIYYLRINNKISKVIKE